MRRDAVKAAFVAAVLAATFAHLAAQPPAGQGQGQGRGDGRGATPPAPAPAEPVLSPGPSAARFPRDAAEFDQMFQKVKNWGRWGADDQLGAANLITEAKRRQAAELVKQGVSVSLAHNPLTETAADNPQPVRAHDEPRVHDRHLSRVVSRLRAQPHRRALPHPLPEADLQRLLDRRHQHRKGLHEAGHRSAEERHRDARDPDRHPAAAQRQLPRAGHAGVRRGSGGVGEEGADQDRHPATRSSCAPAAGRAVRRSARGRWRETPPATTRRSRRG